MCCVCSSISSEQPYETMSVEVDPGHPPPDTTHSSKATTLRTCDDSGIGIGTQIVITVQNNVAIIKINKFIAYKASTKCCSYIKIITKIKSLCIENYNKIELSGYCYCFLRIQVLIKDIKILILTKIPAYDSL